MKTILVTGSKGFIGKHLCTALDVLGHHVIEADKKLGFDLTKLEDIEALPNVDIVVHLAAFNGTKFFYEEPYNVIRDNVLSTQYLLDFYKGKVEKFIFSGSCESYAGAVDIFSWPVPTDETVPLVIGDVTNPRWSYGGSKLVNELQVQAAYHQYNQKFNILRYHNVYGPGQVDHFIPEFVDRVKKGRLEINGWNNTRSFMYIADAVQATIDIMFNNRCDNEIINVGTNDERSIKDVAEIILKELGISGKLILQESPKGSVSRRQPDITKLSNLIKFTPSINLETGIKLTLQSL